MFGVCLVGGLVLLRVVCFGVLVTGGFCVFGCLGFVCWFSFVWGWGLLFLFVCRCDCLVGVGLLCVFVRFMISFCFVVNYYECVDFGFVVCLVGCWFNCFYLWLFGCCVYLLFGVVFLLLFLGFCMFAFC